MEKGPRQGGRALRELTDAPRLTIIEADEALPDGPSWGLGRDRVRACQLHLADGAAYARADRTTASKRYTFTHGNPDSVAGG